MPKADYKTLVNSLTEGLINLGGCTVFFSSNFDKVASFVTTLEPFAMEASWQGLLFSAPFSLWAAYGAYGCHNEMGKSSQPELKTSPAEPKPAEASVTININTDNSDLQPNPNTIIQELKTLVEELQAKVAELEEDEEKEVNHDTPLTATQKYGKIGGEYVAHCAGFTGAIIGMLRLFWTPALEVELGIQCALFVAGFVSAMSETRLAAKSMRINNLRDSLQRHMLLSHAPSSVAPPLSKLIPNNTSDYKALPG